MIQVNVLGIGSRACSERPRQSCASSLPQRAGVRHPVVVRDHRLAVDQERRGLDAERGVNDGREAIGPVMAVAREAANARAIPAHHQPIAVVLDFVDPDRAGRWSGHPRRPARFAMKPEGRRRWTIRRKAVPAEFVAAVWGAMQATPQHTYQILTKRPDPMADITASLPVLPIVWLGTSVESADYLGRISDLRKVDATVTFVSFEPLLGSVARADLTGIQWAIVGGVSGPRSRPMAEQGSRRLKPHVSRQGRLFSLSSGAVFAKRTRQALSRTHVR